jgi:Fe-S cluster assembly protein SufD
METTKLSTLDKWLALNGDQKTIEGALANDSKALISGMEFPHTRLEEWKYTRTQKLAQGNWKLSAAEVLSDPEFEAVNELTGETSKAFFSVLNAAYCTGAWSIAIPANENMDEAFQFVIKTNGQDTWTQPRILITAKSNSHAKFVFHFEGKDASFCNGVIQVLLEENARVDVDVIQDNDVAHYQVLDINVDQAKGSYCNVVTHTLDGGWVRNNLMMTLNGEGGHANLAGFYLPHGQQFVDNHTIVDHKVPHCTSNELYKGVLYDQSKGVFNGKVFVRRDAQKTEAYQSNKNIMMSDEAVIDTKPELEIYADDVRCSHGSTTGQFDEEALFYLRARGLSAEGAKQLLVSAYVNEVIDRSQNSNVVTFVKNELAKRGRIIADEI